MNPERPDRHEHDPAPYWHDDVGLGEVELQGDRYPLRLRLHRSREQYEEHRELVPLAHPTGERHYLHAKPYILIPDLRLTVDIAAARTRHNGSGSAAHDEQVIGELVAAERVGRRPQAVGNAQGWCYPEDELIMLWECVLQDWCRQAEPLSDALLARTWTALEGVLVESLPDAGRIVTPSWEQVYRRADWQAFLSQQGYHPLNPAVFSKALINDS